MTKTAFILYLSALVIAVLLFGAGHTYAYTLTFLLILPATLLILKSAITTDPQTGQRQFRWTMTGMAPLFLAMAAFLVLQLIPLPQALIKILSPEAWVMAQKSLAATETAVDPSSIPGWASLAPYTYPVRMALVRWLCYGLFFWGLVSLLTTYRRIEIAILVLLGLGFFEVLYGMAENFSGNFHIWWWYKDTPHKDWVTGTYINRNMFAGLLEMLLPLTVGTAIGIGKSGKRKPAFGNQRFRVRLTRFFQRGEDFNKRLFYLFTGVVIGIGLILSGSRAGMIAAACALFVMGSLLMLKKGQRRKGWLILALFCVIGGWALNIGIEKTVARFEKVSADGQFRKRYAESALNLWQDYVWVGNGGGAFQYNYPKYQAAEDRKIGIVYAHNDWAQFLSEFGVVGALIGAGGLIYFLASYIRMWLRRRDGGAIGIGLGCLAGALAMGVHSLFDFNLHYPANFLVMTALLAIGLSAIRLTRHGGVEKSLLHQRRLPVPGSGVFPVAIILLMVVFAGYWSICHFMAETFCSTVPNVTLKRDPLPPVARIDNAISWDPGNAEYRFKKALSLIRDREAAVKAKPAGVALSGAEVFGFQKEIVAAIEQAVALNPFMADYHLRNGWEYTGLWQQPEYHGRYLPAADIAMERAAYRAGVKAPRFHVEMGKYWTMRSRTLEASDSRWEPFWARAGYHFKKALAMELVSRGGIGGGLNKAQQKALLKEIHDYLWAYYPDQAFLKEALGDYADQLPKS